MGKVYVRTLNTLTGRYACMSVGSSPGVWVVIKLSYLGVNAYPPKHLAEYVSTLQAGDEVPTTRGKIVSYHLMSVPDADTVRGRAASHEWQQSHHYHEGHARPSESPNVLVRRTFDRLQRKGPKPATG